MGAISAQAQFPAATSPDKARTREVRHGLPQLAFLVPHDDDDAPGERGGIVSARAAVEITDHAGIVFKQRRVEVTETVNLQRSQKSHIDDPALQAHPHHISKTRPAGCAIENAGIREADGRVQRAHIGDPDFEQRRQIGRMRCFGQETGDLRQLGETFENAANRRKIVGLMKRRQRYVAFQPR